MNKLEQLIKNLCPNGVEYVKIGDYVDFEQPTKYIVKSTDYSDEYKTPVLTPGQSFILGYTNETEGIFMASKENPAIIFDDFTGAFKWVDFQFKVKSSAMKILTAKSQYTSTRYIFHIMGYINFSSNKHKRLWISSYSGFKIPLPPIPIQAEIVRILDSFTELTTELTDKLTTELMTRRKQYEYYQDFLLTKILDAPLVRLGNLCSLITKGTTPKYYVTSGISFVKTESFVGNGIDKEKLSYIDCETHFGGLKRSILMENDILITIAGATIGKCAIVPKQILPANTNQALAIIRLSDSEMVKYVFYILQSAYMKNYMRINIKGSAQPNLNLQQLNDFKLPVPNSTDRERIVSILDRFDKLYNDLTEGLPAEIVARQKQYEYYRDKLLTFDRKE